MESKERRIEGGKRAAKLIKKKFGENYFRELGKKGGIAPTTKPKGFACDRNRAVAAGRKGSRNRSLRFIEIKDKL